MAMYIAIEVMLYKLFDFFVLSFDFFEWEKDTSFKYSIFLSFPCFLCIIISTIYIQFSVLLHIYDWFYSAYKNKIIEITL